MAATDRRNRPPARRSPAHACPPHASAPVAVEEVGDDALLRAVDRVVEVVVGRIELLRLAERRDRILVIALRLPGLAEAAIGVGAGEIEVGPRAAKLRRAPPVACAQHPRSLDLQYRDFR